MSLEKSQEELLNDLKQQIEAADAPEGQAQAVSGSQTLAGSDAQSSSGAEISTAVTQTDSDIFKASSQDAQLDAGVKEVQENIQEKVESKAETMKKAVVEALDTLLFSPMAENIIRHFVKHSGKQRAATVALHAYREYRRPQDGAQQLGQPNV